ncbi:MAG: hypothetical protein NTV07_01170 [Candidatus Omnitrophica bacterium]|nr:hypothetical protein [Candidatus Omnitrophota bacterium]
MVKNTRNKGPARFIFLVLCSLIISGCGAPTYPKNKIYESVVSLCKKEYRIDVDAKVTGNTVAVYLPAENLFDAVFNIDPIASKKINDVILGISRVVISTDATLDFYVVIAQDPKMPEVEIVYIRYVDDVKRFLLGGLSRGEYGKRAVIAIKTPPQAERERIIKELFDKLNIKDADELIKGYVEAEEPISGIGEISYWNKKFFIKEVSTSEFLATQIAERIKTAFREDKDLNKWYEAKTIDGKFVENPGGEGNFVFTVNFSDRVAPLYLESGLELGAQAKRALVFTRLFGIVSETLRAYRFKDFGNAEFITASEKKVITKEEIWRFKEGKTKIEDLI